MKYIVYLALFAVVILSIVVTDMSAKEAKSSIEENVEAHLSEQGYTEEDIHKIETYKADLGSGVEKYHAKVYFADEPEGDYHYSKDAKTGEITQGDYYGSGKHKE